MTKDGFDLMEKNSSASRKRNATWEIKDFEGVEHKMLVTSADHQYPNRVLFINKETEKFDSCDYETCKDHVDKYWYRKQVVDSSTRSSLASAVPLKAEEHGHGGRVFGKEASFAQEEEDVEDVDGVAESEKDTLSLERNLGLIEDAETNSDHRTRGRDFGRSLLEMDENEEDTLALEQRLGLIDAKKEVAATNASMMYDVVNHKTLGGPFASCEAAGMSDVTSKNACELAAKHLGFPHVTAIEFRNEELPSKCAFANGHLFWNAEAAGTGFEACGNYDRPCICKVS